MAFIERVMGLPDPDGGKITVHGTSAAVFEAIVGAATNAQLLAYLGIQGGTPSATEAGAILAAVRDGNASFRLTGTTVAARISRCLELEGVLRMAEDLAAPYDTPAAVRARLGL